MKNTIEIAISPKSIGSAYAATRPNFRDFPAPSERTDRPY